MKFARAKVLMLYSQVVETAMTGDDSILRFVIGHELGHIHRKHLTKSRWLIFSIFIPFLNKAYSRGCEYTCDRIGYHFSQKGAIEGVLILATGKEIYSKINVDHFVDDAVNSGSFWMWFSEKFLSHPHTAKRLNELRKYAQHV
jgi:Zn-dependent protease with chaperone function